MPRSSHGPDKDAVLAALTGRFAEFYGQYAALKSAGGELRGPCPVHNGQRDSFAVNPESGLWHCFSECGDVGGDVFEFLKRKEGLDFPEALAAVAAWAGVAESARPSPGAAGRTGDRRSAGPPSRLDIAQAYDYTDEAGKLLFQVVRLKTPPGSPKEFRQRHAATGGTWVWSLKSVRRVLYHLPEVLAAVRDKKTVWIAEGEKDADALRALGMAATCNPMGASKNKWLDEYSQSLASANVVILPDNDDEGRGHAQRVAASLHGTASRVRIVALPGLPEKGDVSDWLAAGGDTPQLVQLAKPVPDWTPGTVPSPAGRTDKGLPEYAPYQIAQILGIETQAPDSDAALSFRAAQAFRVNLCYCQGLGWLHWGGAHWEADDREGSRTAALFVTLSRKVREEAAFLFRLVSEAIQQGRTEDAAALERAARAHLRHVKVVESEPFAQRAMILARSPLAADVKLFEPRAWLIGFANGVWHKGQWRSHQPEDYLLNLCPVRIESPEAEAPPAGGGEWAAVLERITGGEIDYARTLQEVAGYALSGASHLRILPWAYGGKGTGKSTLAELLTAVLGEGAASIDTKLLSNDAPRERLGASLWGKRLVVCAEAGHQRIDADLLKTLSGGDSYPVRFNYKEAFTGRPTHVLLMTANDPPAMNAYDDALRDRVLALPCNHRLEGDDPAHPDRLIFSEGARIEEVRRNPESALVREFAAWALSGLARLYASQSLYKAMRVQIATAQFWKDTDTLTPFWETVDEAELRKGMTRPDLRRLYEAWCLAEGVRKPIGPQLWTQACRSAGLEETWIDKKRGWELKGTRQSYYTSYTSSPILEQSRLSQEMPHKGLSENSNGSVGSVVKPGAPDEVIVASCAHDLLLFVTQAGPVKYGQIVAEMKSRGHTEEETKRVIVRLQQQERRIENDLNAGGYVLARAE
jgi:putative DNA primase/helicase